MSIAKDKDGNLCDGGLPMQLRDVGFVSHLQLTVSLPLPPFLCL